MRHLELFAGIGGFRQALELLSKDGVMRFSSVGYSEIDANALNTYRTIYTPSDEEVNMGDIVEFNSDENRIQQLPDFELLTAGFPCQTFSMMGKQEGFYEDRGQMFFRIMDIVRVKRPRYLLLENVRNLFTHDRKRTFKRIKNDLEKEGYSVFANIFNTEDFYLPQTRNRVFIFATLNNEEISFQNIFTSKHVKEAFEKQISRSSLYSYNNTLELLDLEVEEKYYLSERIKPTILSDGSGGFKSNSEINLLVARPLTASMHKMHRACQDNYYSKNFIETKGRENPAKTHTKEELAKLPIRKLTPEEAFALQGFPKQYVTLARASKVSDGALYKQAGNAVSVNTIYAILYYLITNNIIR